MSIIQYPCPICHQLMTIIGHTKSGKKIGSCGHSWRFKRSRSEKELDRMYIKTPDGGLELK